MRILLTYPGATYSTYDVAAGYEKALSALGHEVRSFNHHGWLSFYDITLAQWQLYAPEQVFPDAAARVIASEHVVIEAVDFVPDVILIVAAMGLHRRAFELLNHLGVPIIVLLTESPYEDGIQAKVLEKGHVSLAFTNERTSAQRLETVTGVQTIYLPHAYDASRHRVLNIDEKHRSDVFFQGTLWPKRKRLLDSLADLPYKMIFDGIQPQARNREEADESMTHVIDNSEMPFWYSGTKIAINHHREFCTIDKDGLELYLESGEAESLGPRAFEIAACGAFQLCDNTRPELQDVFGDSVVTYDDTEDLRDKVKYYLRNDHKRREMAKESHRRVQGCTFEARARDIIIPALEMIRR